MKTIEEAAKEYAENSNVTQDNFCLYDEIDAFEAGANYIMSLPLADRLTNEEKEKITQLYMLANIVENECNRGYKNALIEIFGTAMFEEKGGCNE